MLLATLKAEKCPTHQLKHQLLLTDIRPYHLSAHFCLLDKLSEVSPEVGQNNQLDGKISQEQMLPECLSHETLTQNAIFSKDLKLTCQLARSTEKTLRFTQAGPFYTLMYSSLKHQCWIFTSVVV